MIIKEIKFKTLTQKIWLTYTLVILAIIVGISLLYFFVIIKIEKERVFNNLEMAQSIFEDTVNNNSIRELERINIKDTYHIIINISNDNVIIREFPKGPPKLPVFSKWIQTNIFKLEENARYIERYRNRQIYFVITKLSDQENSYIITYTDKQQNNQLYSYIIIIALIFIFIGFLTSKIISNSITNPLLKLEKYTEKIASKKWSDPLEVKSIDEIGRLTKAMNNMQFSLKRADEEEKFFLQSISHDLKTPVMVIESFAQAIIDGIYIGSMDETAQTIKDEAARLKNKINKLLYINSLSYIMNNENICNEIKLKELLDSLCHNFRLIRKDIVWEIEGKDGLIYANEEKIKIAFENILENGIRFADGKITVKITSQSGILKVKIYNDGPHIKKENLNNLFNKFYKDSRGCFGLGLAISKSIINFYNGRITVRNENIGVSFYVELPDASSSN